jgi:hypothetical protein
LDRCLCHATIESRYVDIISHRDRDDANTDESPTTCGLSESFTGDGTKKMKFRRSSE